MIVRPATKEDIDRCELSYAKPSVKAWVIDDDGVKVLGGFALINGRWFVFCDIEPGYEGKYKTALGRIGYRAFQEMKRMGVRYIYAEADPKIPTSVRWLVRLGFMSDPRNPHLYRWENG